MTGRFTKGSLTVSMIVGTLLVPLTALAAIWLTGPNDGGEEDAAAVTTTSAVPVSSVPTAPQTTVGVTPADLLAACGPDGQQLVNLEVDGTISDVQQAALDALRDLCDQQGLPLPAKPGSEPVVRTVIVPAASTPTTAAAAPATTQSENRDNEYQDDDHDEYEEEDEHAEHDERESHDEDDDHSEGDD